jgi:5S rRNA maturation endonuclease (ribonuclease M5)
MQQNLRDYLASKGVKIIKENGNEVAIHCLFSNCDADSTGTEAHLYISAETGEYHCKKCGASGNLITLKRHFGDSMAVVKVSRFSPNLIEKFHAAIPDGIRRYLNGRGITDAIISSYRLGYASLLGKEWITIPIRDRDGNYIYLKLRQDPTQGNDKMMFPRGEPQLYGWENLNTESDTLVICEGEFDRLLLVSKGVNAITSTHGAGTFKLEWINDIKKFSKIYLCLDNDDAGKRGASRIADMFDKIDHKGIFIVSLPEMTDNGKDITDYFISNNGTVEDLFAKYAKPYPEPIDTSRFKPISMDEIRDILGLTIKNDDENKIVTFLCDLSAFTDNAQFNIMFQAPSSSGKSFIPMEIISLFPKESTLILSNASPTSFFHEHGEFDKEKNETIVDLSRIIIVFLDMKSFQLLERMRPLLSHDDKEIRTKITDKNEKGGNRTKTVVIRGFPSFIFCSTSINLDEQEATRFILLSPETNIEKIKQGVHQAIVWESDRDAYRARLEADPNRRLLIERIKAIKQEKIQEIKITNQEKVEKRFLEYAKILKPRHQRDAKRVISLIKSIALVNLWWRERDGSTIIANEEDIDAAFRIWEKIALCQELQISPYILEMYQKVILPLWNKRPVDDFEGFAQPEENRAGISRKDISRKHFQVYGRTLDDIKLRQTVLPAMEAAGLIIQEPDKDDKRKMLVFPIYLDDKKNQQVESRNSVDDNGVDVL